MSTCLVTLDPRTLSVVLSDFEPRERSTLISLLAHMWCNEGHVEASAKVLARRAGLRPSSFHKSLAILLDGGALALRDGRVLGGSDV